MSDLEPVRMLDLRRVLGPVDAELAEAWRRVVGSGWFLLGREGEEFEEAFSSWVGRKHGVGCAQGTDAITLALMAADIGSGDEVITVANTAFATACGISRSGATPVFADVDPNTWLMDPESALACVGPRTKAVVVVHLFGQMVDVPALERVLPADILIVEDCAQAHGAVRGGRSAGSLARMAAFSFYPSKNLGALGDAGMVVTDDDILADRLRALRFYGQTSRDNHEVVGLNSRLDEMQAAMLATMLPHVEGWIERRRKIAAAYDRHLPDSIFVRPHRDGRPAFHQYPVLVEERARFRAFLAERGIETAVHYPVPIPLQPAYADSRRGAEYIPHAISNSERIVSLPISPHLSEDEVARVIAVCGDYSEVLR